MTYQARSTGRVAATATCILVGAALWGSATPAAATTATESPADHLIAHYDFTGDLVNTGIVADSSGHGLNASLVNSGSARIVAGATSGDTALDLPGGSASSTGAYVQLPTSLLSGKTDLTVSIRARWDGTGGAWQRLFDLGQDTSRYLFATPSNGSVMRAAITTTGAGGEAQTSGYAPMPTDAWKTVTATLDTEGKRLSLYLDGALVATAPTSVTAQQLINSSASRAGYIGKSQYPDSLFGGDVDDFAVYDTALTADQVAGLVNAVPSVTGLSSTTFDVRAEVGTAPALPSFVRGSFTDGYDRAVPIAWQPVDPAKYAALGSFTVNGNAAGTPVTAYVTVARPNELTVDLSKDTGAFMGGASGTLYGVYGNGLPTSNLIEGMGLRTVATKAQDGPQHPGADALDVVKPLSNVGGDTYIYMTDIYRGFPYEWPGDTPEARLNDFKSKIAKQVDQVLTLPKNEQDHVVFVPFNEPEGNMFGTGTWSYNKVSWLDDPQYYFKAWDDVYHLIKGKMPAARIAGPNTSVLFTQIQGYLKHVVAADTVPDVMTWHELSNPAAIRTNVPLYRQWEATAFNGTKYDGRKLPINLDEYAFNYHTSVPGQMIQWASAIEDTKVDADIAYWNIDGNLSDSAVQSNRGNGQWWLLNAYGQMTGHTVKVTAPRPNVSYTLQGVATYDQNRRQAKVLLGGASGESFLQLNGVDSGVFGAQAHVQVQEIPWTGQIGDSPQPEPVAEFNAPVSGSGLTLHFGAELPALKESSAYQVIVSPGANATSPSKPTNLFEQTYEAENAKYTGSGYSKNGPEGTPNRLGNFYTSGQYDVGGLRTGSNGVLDFNVTVPQDGSYDLSVFANSLNNYPVIQKQGPTNIFVRVDGGAEQEIYLPLGYKWVVWDHSDTKVKLTKGDHVISLAAQSLDGTSATQGDAIIDRIDLALPNPAATPSIYEAENATLTGATPSYSTPQASGAGVVPLGVGQSATFWVYSAQDAPATLGVDAIDTNGSDAHARLLVNGEDIRELPKSKSVPVFLRGGINKVTLTGTKGTFLLDRLRVGANDASLPTTTYQAEDGTLSGSAAIADLSLAQGGKAVTDIGGAPGNDNALTFNVTAATAGRYMVTVRYSNPEQSPATHYNPDPLARHAEVSVNGGKSQRVWFPHSFHQNNFWELSFPVTLAQGANTLTFGSQELPDFDGDTYISDRYPEPLRSKWAPIIDQIGITPES